MLKKNKRFTKKKNIIPHILIIVLIIINICLCVLYTNSINEEKDTSEVYFTQVDGSYDKNQKYYAPIKYSNFTKLLKSSDITTVAIVDNTSNTYNKFIEMINKISFYKSTKIYLLEVSKLSKKNEAAFYEIDERLSSLETNYIITISNNKVLSITTFDKEYLNRIVEGIGE